MKISSEGDYAIRILLYMSSNKNTTFSGKHIVTACCIPEKLGFRVLTKLSSANLLNSTKGINGGFTFVQNPEFISLLDIIKLFDKIELSKCIDSPEHCGLRHGDCVVCREFEAIRNNLLNDLARVSLKYLLEKEKSS